MGAILSQLLDQLNSSVFVLLAILGIMFWIVHRIGVWRERFGGYSQKLGALDDMREKMVELSTKVDLIYHNTNPRSLVASHSPLDLTDLGHKVSHAIGAREIFMSYRGQLIAAIDQRCPTGSNAYDIQVAALDIAKKDLPNLLSAGEINKIKEVAFAQGILLEDVWAIFGIFLRNVVLQERRIPVIEVDRHDPLREA